jgi:hypothetical protein
VTGHIDPHGGDAGGSKVVFREEFVARRLCPCPGAMRIIFGSVTSSIVDQFIVRRTNAAPCVTTHINE